MICVYIYTYVLCKYIKCVSKCVLVHVHFQNRRFYWLYWMSPPLQNVSGVWRGTPLCLNFSPSILLQLSYAYPLWSIIRVWQLMLVVYRSEHTKCVVFGLSGAIVRKTHEKSELRAKSKPTNGSSLRVIYTSFIHFPRNIPLEPTSGGSLRSVGFRRFPATSPAAHAAAHSAAGRKSVGDRRPSLFEAPEGAPF